MILGISTSSPRVSIATWTDDEILVELTQESKWAASSAIANLTEKAIGDKMHLLTGIVVDVGPGGFTGVRVGVTFAKAFAWAKKVPLFSVSAFNLISVDQAVHIPSKRDEWWLRAPGQSPRLQVGTPLGASLGYGADQKEARFPTIADVFRRRIPTFACDPYELVPAYFAEPNISTPKSDRVLKVVDR